VEGHNTLVLWIKLTLKEKICLIYFCKLFLYFTLKFTAIMSIYIQWRLYCTTGR